MMFVASAPTRSVVRQGSLRRAEGQAGFLGQKLPSSPNVSQNSECRITICGAKNRRNRIT